MSSIEIIVGLPHLNEGPILQRAIARRMPILISANCLSRWSTKHGWPEWLGWNTRPLQKPYDLPSVDLDSAGFVAHKRYGGFPWTIDAYLALARTYPFRRFASLDYCVEEEIASDPILVTERISRTVGANRECYRLAKMDGIADRFMPVLQGRTPDDYARCADALSDILEKTPVVGVGSMCRRVTNGSDGLIAVVEKLDRILPSSIRLHCFGVKGPALSKLSLINGRVASIDSQAYGVAARQNAYKSGISKTNKYVADHMEHWFNKQTAKASRKESYQIPLLLDAAKRAETDSFELCMQQARDEILELIESGELDHDQHIDRWIFDTACDLYSERSSTNP